VAGSDLASNVEEVMLRLMQGVYRDPPQRSFTGLYVSRRSCIDNTLVSYQAGPKSAA
jgi:hypothetical protein